MPGRRSEPEALESGAKADPPATGESRDSGRSDERLDVRVPAVGREGDAEAVGLHHGLEPMTGDAKLEDLCRATQLAEGETTIRNVAASLNLATREDVDNLRRTLSQIESSVTNLERKVEQ